MDFFIHGRSWYVLGNLCVYIYILYSPVFTCLSTVLPLTKFGIFHDTLHRGKSCITLHLHVLLCYNPILSWMLNHKRCSESSVVDLYVHARLFNYKLDYSRHVHQFPPHSYMFPFFMILLHRREPCITFHLRVTRLLLCVSRNVRHFPPDSSIHTSCPATAGTTQCICSDTTWHQLRDGTTHPCAYWSSFR